MIDTFPTMTLSPQTGLLLTKITDIPDLNTALWRVLHDYTGLKMQQLARQIEAFELKWGMTFEEFSQRSEFETLGQDPYAYDVESDFWDWEKTVTLFEHYKALQIQWT